jgi:hypothetical protein
MLKSKFHKVGALKTYAITTSYTVPPIKITIHHEKALPMEVLKVSANFMKYLIVLKIEYPNFFEICNKKGGFSTPSFLIC